MKITTLNTRILAALCSCLLLPLTASATGSDDFDDNSKDPTKWGNDVVAGFGVLTETNQRLQYTCTTGTIDDFVDRPWILTQFPFDADWSIQIDTFNSTVPFSSFEVNSMGIDLFTPDGMNNLYAEMYASNLGGGGARNGFASALESPGGNVGRGDSGGQPGLTQGAVRVDFAGLTKVLTVSYDLDVSDGYQWVQFGSFGLAGSGGANGNFDWALTGTQKISAFVYGFSAGMTVTGGQMFIDNFMETGGVTSTTPPPSIVPTGNFLFAFPTNNPALIAIASLAGNYRGLTQEEPHRNYNVDLAQDDSGKLAVMGTMDGILDNRGNSQISGNVGSVVTMNGEPTAQLSGNLAGTRDGTSFRFNAMASGPAEIVDIGGGQPGVMGTGSFNATVGGIPESGQNVPFLFAAPPDAQDKFRRDWSLDLKLRTKSKKKVGVSSSASKKDDDTDVFASGTLILPNDDVISFKERKVKYLMSQGLFEEINFENGTNTSLTPPKKTGHAKIRLRRVTFSQQNGVFTPTGGTIEYQFLGQKGTANLADFLGAAPGTSKGGKR